MMRTLLAFFLCAAALLAGDNTGRRAPGFALPDSTMKVYDLADYRGKLVILEFMQTDCPHCQGFAPVLNEIKAKYGDKVAVLSVTNSQHDNATQVAQFVATYKVAHPILFDAGQMQYSYVLKLTFDNPYVCLIDGNGIIQNDFNYNAFTAGLFELKGLSAEIDRILNANASPVPKRL